MVFGKIARPFFLVPSSAGVSERAATYGNILVQTVFFSFCSRLTENEGAHCTPPWLRHITEYFDRCYGYKRIPTYVHTSLGSSGQLDNGFRPRIKLKLFYKRVLIITLVFGHARVHMKIFTHAIFTIFTHAKQEIVQNLRVLQPVTEFFS